jgi:hypothetical protein
VRDLCQHLEVHRHCFERVLSDDSSIVLLIHLLGLQDGTECAAVVLSATYFFIKVCLAWNCLLEEPSMTVDFLSIVFLFFR